VAASTINGTRFDTVALTLPPSPFLVLITDYELPIAGLERVNITLTRIPFGEVPGLTPNQRAVGTGLETASRARSPRARRTRPS
jgi:hypothetical protein